MAVKSPTEAVALQTSALKPAVEKAVDYSRSLYEISSESQKQLAKMVEAQFADFQKNVSSMVAQATKSAPAGSETIMAAMQSADRCRQLGFRQHDGDDQATDRNRPGQHGRRDQEEVSKPPHPRSRPRGRESKIAGSIRSLRCHKAAQGFFIHGIARRTDADTTRALRAASA
jgi:hypothetical protein